MTDNRAPRRIRHEVADAVAQMALSLALSVVVAGLFVLLVRLGTR
ncbi:hypothetical protein HMPREF0063_11060 [Aeromicrobium marinum DSM 15272]|uniref:Uncharacterized protein n=1 Tax=Aeromicrobium marinum DSM 15272 TaxID=585531 RepID=E2SAK2_9ACTN|nr:hypothetical protein [Aeromicrobium marinum]EFQ83398.1 hypothetical protein HMPREF0063_11060 [Aeromicrobium marinum DSM 15272]